MDFRRQAIKPVSSSPVKVGPFGQLAMLEASTDPSSLRHGVRLPHARSDDQTMLDERRAFEQADLQGINKIHGAMERFRPLYNFGLPRGPRGVYSPSSSTNSGVSSPSPLLAPARQAASAMLADPLGIKKHAAAAPKKVAPKRAPSKTQAQRREEVLKRERESADYEVEFNKQRKRKIESREQMKAARRRSIRSNIGPQGRLTGTEYNKNRRRSSSDPRASQHARRMEMLRAMGMTG